MSRPHIAISMGDPAGVGPELICRLCADVELSQRASITVYGSKTIFQRVSEALNIPAPHHIVECCGDIDDDLKTLQPGARYRKQQEARLLPRCRRHAMPA